MYASFFGLRELPFNNTPDPRFFYSTPDHEEALASLVYAISESKGFVLLTGEVGAGKTLMTRLMLRHFNDRIVFAGINHTSVSPTDLLRCICGEFQVDYHADDTAAHLLRRLQDFLIGRFSEGKPVVLMLDEAQALSRDAFEQVRMIGNLEADDAKLLQIVIVGQPELRERFQANDMRQLRQRMFRSFHLRGLTREQTEGYIRHRLSVGGAQYPERIFDSAAVDLIFEYSQGLPRLINTVCDNAMLSAYAADQLSIDAEFVRRVLTQMSSVTQGGPNFASPRVQPEASAPPPASVPQASLAPHGPVNAPAAPVSESANVERFVANATQQLNSAARQVTDDVLRQLTAAADRLRDERESLARTDHLHQQHRTAPSGRSELLGSAGKLHEAISHADAVHQRLGQSVADAEQRIEAIVQRAGRIESSLHRVLQQMDTAGERCAPVISQLRTHTDQARKILGQTRTAISAAESSVQTTRRARDEVEQTAERLRQQSLRGGQLTLTLKSAYDRLTRQTVLLDQRANGEAESPATRQKQATPSDMLDRARKLVHVIDGNRTSIADVRATVASTRQALRNHPRTKLGAQVRSLTEMIEEQKPVPAH
jgi:general secretion pathway protein A